MAADHGHVGQAIQHADVAGARYAETGGDGQAGFFLQGPDILNAGLIEAGSGPGDADFERRLQ